MLTILSTGAGNDYGFGKIIDYDVPDSSLNVLAVGLGTKGPETVWNIKKNHGLLLFLLKIIVFCHVEIISDIVTVFIPIY